MSKVELSPRRQLFENKMKSALVFTILIALVAGDYYKARRRPPPPTSFSCPANFVRTKHNKCYYFSREAETFDQAYWSCDSRRSTLAVIRGRNQDNTLRRLLNKNKIQHVERWIGARYNWERKKWQWAANGKLLNYTGFYNDPKDADGWQCIVLDPKLQYKWNFKSCLEKKHFICQTRLKKSNIPPVKYDKNQNEVLLEVPDNDIPVNWTKTDLNKQDNAIGKTSSAYSPKPKRVKGKGRKGKGRKRNRNNNMNKDNTNADNLSNADAEAQQDAPILKENPMGKKIKYVTYHGEAAGPLHPRIIVEDFDFLKNETSG